MNTKIVFSTILAWTLVGFSSAFGQYRNIPVDDSYSAMPLPETSDAPKPTPRSPQFGDPTRPSEWILYRQCEDCYCPAGGHGPIGTEFYLRVGPSFAYGDGTFGQVLDSGWGIQGGARLMFFNHPRDRAWYMDLSLINIWNDANRPDVKVPLSVLVPDPTGTVVRVNFGEGGLPGVTIREFNRTFVNFGIGRKWYINGAANCGNFSWRVGAEAGGRYGSGNVEFLEIQKRSDTLGGVYVSLGSDAEIPCGCCTFWGGIRTEWAYTWSDILQRTDADVEEILLMFTAGIRY